MLPDASLYTDFAGLTALKARAQQHSGEALDDVAEQLCSRYADAKADETDGLRLEWPDRWVHVRTSNTEPIVRLIAEAPTAKEAEGLCQSAADLL